MGLSSYRDFFLHSEETNHGDHPFIIMMKSENLGFCGINSVHWTYPPTNDFLSKWDGLHIHEESFRRWSVFFFVSFPSRFPFYLLYDKSRSNKENHQIIIRINWEIPFPSSFLLKLFYLRTSDFPPAFLAKLKSFLFELYYEWYWFIRFWSWYR